MPEPTAADRDRARERGWSQGFSEAQRVDLGTVDALRAQLAQATARVAQLESAVRTAANYVSLVISGYDDDHDTLPPEDVLRKLCDALDSAGGTQG